MPRRPLVLALFFFSAAVAEEDLVTDRPDQTESAVVVPNRTWQVEMGLGTGGGGGEEVLEVPGTLVRHGLSERLEARLAWPGWIRMEREGDEVSGLGDPELGVKFGLRTGPDLALLAHVSLPWGEEEVGAADPLPSLRLAGAHDLSPRVGLGWNAGLAAHSALTAGGRARRVRRPAHPARARHRARPGRRAGVRGSAVGPAALGIDAARDPHHASAARD